MGGSSGEWLEAALLDLAGRVQTALQLDADVVSGLVSYCELAPPEDAREYLTNIVGPEASGDLIREYLQRRGFRDSTSTAAEEQPPALQPYVKPAARDGFDKASKKPARIPTDNTVRPPSSALGRGGPAEEKKFVEGRGGGRKKKGGKVAVSLAEAAKGAVVFKQGRPCDCQARRHGLVSNCLSCGKIVCEQEGEGPCSFCGALVLREGSDYAGLEGSLPPPSAAEASAEAFTKRLVEYDRNSAARTTVIDDQSDYYEFEGNSWLSNQEKEDLARNMKQKEEEEEQRRKKVVVTFDLLGRKVVAHEELSSEQRILRPLENREAQRITPNPAAAMRPVYIEAPSPSEKKGRPRQRFSDGFCLEITGRVQHHSSSDDSAALTHASAIG